MSRPRLIVLLLALARAAAAGGDTDDEVAAKNHFLSGTSYYDEGRYADALREFQEAYRLSKRPSLLYNVGACFDHLGRLREAVGALKGYLAAVPDAEDRTSVEKRIATFEAQFREQEAKERAAQDQAARDRAAREGTTPAPPPTVVEPAKPAPTITIVSCAPGKVMVDGHCCAPGEQWSDARQACLSATPAPPEESTQITFAGSNDDTHYAVFVESHHKEHSCVTPCAVTLPRGMARVSVGAGDHIFFTKPLEVPRHPSLVRLSVRCTECYVGGAALFVAGVVAGALGLGLGNPNASDLGVKIPSFVVPIGGGLLALVGAILFFSGGGNKMELSESLGTP
jgi:hypothetical protein